MYKLVIPAVGLLIAATMGHADAQVANPNAGEFIQSSSPLPGGGIVTTTYHPTSNSPPVTTVSYPAGFATYPDAATVPSLAGAQSVLTSPAPPATNSPTQLHTAQLPQLPATPPATVNGPTIVVPTWGNPFAGPRRYLPANYQPQIPTTQTTTGYLPSGTVYPYPTAPTSPATGNSIVVSPPPIPSDPRVNYQPIFKLQNLPPGTYMGQGWLGQPKAYVDGQPIRNLLRYVFP
jgi:hypothetical protein